MLAFDTNLLFYAVNRSSPFHEAALAFLESIREDPKVAVCEFALLELYCLLRNPKVNAKPLGPEGAVQVIEAYRHHPTWRLVGFSQESRKLHDRLWKLAARRDFAYRRVYDVRMALALIDQGVTRFATVNVKDFEDLGFQQVWNPLDQPAENDR